MEKFAILGYLRFPGSTVLTRVVQRYLVASEQQIFN